MGYTPRDTSRATYGGVGGYLPRGGSPTPPDPMALLLNMGGFLLLNAGGELLINT